MKRIEKITKSQIQKKGVQALADRPNAQKQYGQSGLAAQELKLWFDNLAQLIAEKVNELVETLSAEDAAAYVRVALDSLGIDNLGTLIETTRDGRFAASVLKVYPSASGLELICLQEYINITARKIAEMVEDFERVANTAEEIAKTAAGVALGADAAMRALAEAAAELPVFPARTGDYPDSFRLGDSINSRALTPGSGTIGDGCIAGGLGYYYKSIDAENKYIYLSRVQMRPVFSSEDNIDNEFGDCGYTAGDKLSIFKGNTEFADALTVTAAEHNRITYEGELPFSDLPDAAFYNEKTYCVYVFDKPDIENGVPVHNGAIATGQRTRAIGTGSFTIGYETEAADAGEAHGCQTRAKGLYSEAHNMHTEALAPRSNSWGNGTKAVADSQNSFGRFNEPDENAAETVGGGSDDAHRKNIRTLDWEGNETLAGTLKLGRDAEGDCDAVTKRQLEGYDELHDRGEWNPLIMYARADFVSRNGKLYEARRENVGSDPALSSPFAYSYEFRDITDEDIAADVYQLVNVTVSASDGYISCVPTGNDSHFSLRSTFRDKKLPFSRCRYCAIKYRTRAEGNKLQIYTWSEKTATHKNVATASYLDSSGEWSVAFIDFSSAWADYSDDDVVTQLRIDPLNNNAYQFGYTIDIAWIRFFSGEADALATTAESGGDWRILNSQNAASAYAAAIEGGYSGTQSDFYADLGAMDGLAAWFAQL